MDAEQVPAPWLRSVVCGVDGTAAGREAARQAAELTGAHGRLELVAVTPGAGLAPFVLPAATAARVLFEAQNLAQRACSDATTSMIAAHHIAAAHLAFEHGAELETVSPTTIATDATVFGCGLIVVSDNALAVQIARAALCSVLVVRRRD